MLRLAREGAWQAQIRHGPLVRCFTDWAAAIDPTKISGKQPAQVHNLVNGEWCLPASSKTIPDPLNGEGFIRVPMTGSSEIGPFVESLKAVPKSGLHNPIKNPERYNLYGEITAKAAAAMRQEEVVDFFTRLVQRVSPKSYAQALGRSWSRAAFLENFSGDQVRFTARSFAVSGDHAGQQSTGMRWPYGPVALITPFNFPLEIPALQLMGALYMGNKPLLHVDHRVTGVIIPRQLFDRWDYPLPTGATGGVIACPLEARQGRRVSIVAEAFLRLLHDCGMPKQDADFMNGSGSVMNEVLLQARPRNTLFTGSSRIGEKLAVDLSGRLFLEDAGFDWKVLGPDVAHPDYVAWVCDQDAYACSGQKCSAQSVLFMHSNWAKAGLEKKLAERAAKRKLEDLTVGPVLTWTTEAILKHLDRLLQIPGARLVFGGKPLEGHSIPPCYGAVEPTAVFVPLEEAAKEEHFPAVATEVFGPFQVLTEYRDEQLPLVLELLERLHANLTAAVVSNDPLFLQKVLGSTVNGTTYAGIRARTTGAPQNHWFGPCGDPRAAGIGTPEAIRLVWSTHREIITDVGPVPEATTYPTT